ncbi:hypothetical protein [Thalassotalea piscium]|uniref:DUF2897 family protein n=1 Tax=Thalassotalea piscium TaxID=1230533 RepID=A0A7X0NGR8_9GAMM|nr:hypothetical protein [Thalassotalea piscium]MBB6543172.1 hypothetical protein [Thalassotalea piscium]
MDNWLAWVVIVISAVIFIGNLSTFQKSTKFPMRKKGLNDLKETLPRSHKTDHKLPTHPNKNIHKK